MPGENADMQTRKIGSLDVTIAGLGCGNFGFFIDEVRSRAVVAAALDEGVRHFDVADIYGEGRAEEYLGRALGKRRPEIVITTKFGGSTPPDGLRPASAQWVRRACEASLKRLGTDWIDLLLLHHPDPATPIAETLASLADLQTAGMVREIGCSNFDAAQLQEAAAAARMLGVPGFRTVQNSYSLLDRTPEIGLLPTSRALGVSLMPYMPLASGMLTGKYRRDRQKADGGRLGLELRGMAVRDYFPGLLTDECFDVVEALEQLAESLGIGLADLALSWLASRPDVPTVIAGATDPEQLRRNVAAITRPLPDAGTKLAIERITRADVAFPWNAGFPSYARMPRSAENRPIPDVRKQAPQS